MNKFAEHIKQHMGKTASKRSKVTKKAEEEFFKEEKQALQKLLNTKEPVFKIGLIFDSIPTFFVGDKQNEEYAITANEEDIQRAVEESIEDLFDGMYVSEFVEKVIPFVGTRDVYDYLSDYDEYDPNLMGYKYQGSVDFESLAKAVIREYDAGHELAPYDGITETVDVNGKTYYIFRQAKKTKKMTKKAKGTYDLSAKNAMENENFFRDYLKENIYGFTFTSDSSHTNKKPYEWDVIFYPNENLLTDKKFTINEKNKDYEIKYYSDEPNGSFLMITFHDINLPILNKVVKYVNRELPELIEKNKGDKVAKKTKTNKLADIIRKEISKSAGSIDYEVMMDIPKEKIESTKDLVKEIGLKHHIHYTDTMTFGETGTIRFTLPMEEANELIKELESKGFRLLRREKKDNRTQYEWERDQKIYD